MNELVKPCPFCGNDPKTVVMDNGKKYVWCVSKCPLKDIEILYEFWQTRPVEETLSKARIAELETAAATAREEALGWHYQCEQLKSGKSPAILPVRWTREGDPAIQCYRCQGCNNKFIRFDDGPKKNGYKFCPGCGHPIHYDEPENAGELNP